MIAQESIEQVRAQAKIAEVVGERVKLERRGRSLIGLCPFHSEKTPSFHVNDERGFYYCFGCHASGDAIKFVQETEGFSFIEAIRELAERLAIELVETGSERERREEFEIRRRRDELYAVNQAAAAYFQRCLREHPLANLAHAELERRGLDPNDAATATALEAFLVGYAPPGWDGLTQHLRESNASLVAAERVGLIAPRKQGSGYYDRFRHRLMFAIVDLSGRVVGFSGRNLELPTDEQYRSAGLKAPGPTSEGTAAAKYINSPESQIYKKRETVFGLYQARSAIRSAGSCLVVEGNFDVVSLHARHVLHVVAPLGTALTEEQARQIKRYSETLTLLFDGDAAGKRASAAARQPCRAAGLRVSVASLPEGIDPDELARRKGAEAVLQCARSAKGMLEYLIESTLDSRFRAQDPEVQGQKIQEVLRLIGEEPDPTVRALAQHHADTVAARLGIRDARSLAALKRSIQRAGDTDKPASATAVAPPERARSRPREQAIGEEIVGALVEYPSLLQHAALAQSLPHVSGELALTLSILARIDPRRREELERLPARAQQIALQRLVAPTLPDQETALRVLQHNLFKVVKSDRKRIKDETIERLKEAQRIGDIDEEMRLLMRLKELSTPRAF